MIAPRFLNRISLMGAMSLVLAGLAGPAFSQKSFTRYDLLTQGAAMEQQIKTQVSVPQGADLARMQRAGEAALQKNDPRAALPIANQMVVTAPANPEAWRFMARTAKALSIQTREWRERYDMQERALGAAYLAYDRAKTKPEEGISLALLASMLEWRENWRPALAAYRAALTLHEDAAVRTSYETLRAKRGFRLLSHEVDSDAASPRACFSFSEPLARGKVDYAPYVAISGKGDFAVSADESQICVDGLKHGERYGVILRQGIPSIIPEETLLKNADYEIYVRDRSPSVRTSGKTYVLPRTGQQGVPVVSVNTDKVSVRVSRIGDRNLINTVRSGDFMEQMGTFQFSRILEESGQPVWSGVMDVKNELNKDVTTAFPIVEAAGKLQPGVYAMVVRPGEPKVSATDKANPDDEDMGGEDGEGRGRLATQWFVVSDLGLTSFSGNDGVHVFIRSLADASPVADAEIRLLARNNEVLATLKSDKDGHARFDAGLSRGEGGLAPGLVTVQSKDDYGFLDLLQTAFDLSDRGVSGRVAPKGLDAYVYAERGVYRPGETVHLASLIRDSRGGPVTGMPMTIVIRRPDGMEYRRSVVDDQGGGGRALSVPLLSNAATGTWRVLAFSDPKRPAIGETTFLVEDYVPERLELTLLAKDKALTSGQNAEIDVDVRYLYGAPGADLSVGGTVIVRKADKSAIPGFEGYNVGLADEAVEAARTEISDKQTTDEHGKAKFSIELKEPDTNLPLEAEISLTASENGGRGVTRNITLPILPKGNAVGIKPLFNAEEVGDGGTVKFGVILATGQGKRIAQSGVKWQLVRINRNYQWFYKEGRWAYEAIRNTRRIADGDLTTSLSADAEISAKVGWGTYRIEARSGGADDAVTAFEFTVGYVAETKADTPDVLDVSLDKKGYADGETMHIRLASRFNGKATLAVISDHVTHTQLIDVSEGGTTASVKVSGQWGASAYLVVLAHRPLDQKALRMPGRAIGLSWFTIGKEARKIAVDLGAPALTRPRGALNLPVKLTGLEPGKDAFITVAAVDVGILNLTRYQSPNASAHFFGQRQISTDIRDLYAYLIDGMQGTRGQIRSGGDVAPAAQGERPTQEPLARFSGVVKVGPDGTAPISFDLPAFNGSVRVMAVAWSGGKTGEANADVIVRDPIVVQPTVPRFLALGDRSRFHVEINNVEGESGDYTLDLDLKGPVSVVIDPALRNLKLEKGKKTAFTLPVTVAGLGIAQLDLTLSGKGHSLSQSVRVAVKPSTSTLTNRTARPLAPGASVSISNDLLADLVPNSGQVSVSVSPFAALDVPALLSALDRYPYGCTEQTVSRAMPLLYLNRLASMEQLALDDKAEARIAGAIERVLSRQGSNGAFGLWSVGSGGNLWLDAFVVDFLTRARENNIAVPQTAFMLALDRLRNQVVNTTDIREEEASGLAYALYVLARNGRPVMGDLRYLVDNKLNEFTTANAQGHLGAALALLGDRTRAKTAFDAAQIRLAGSTENLNYRADYGSKLRDGASLLAMMAETGIEKAAITKVASEVDNARQRSRYTSTQEQTAMVMAAQALAKEVENFTILIDGAAHKGALYRSFTQARLDQKAITFTNPGQAEARVILSVSGVPSQPEPELFQSYRITRKIFTMDGASIEPNALKQNERYVVVIDIPNAKSRSARLLVVDPLPAGLEIENANLTEGASTEGLSFIGERATPDHTEARDDRFVAAFDVSQSSKMDVKAAYIVRAVTPGSYVHPAASVEDMYRPQVFGRTAFGGVEIASAAPEKK